MCMYVGYVPLGEETEYAGTGWHYFCFYYIIHNTYYMLYIYDDMGMLWCEWWNKGYLLLTISGLYFIHICYVI